MRAVRRLARFLACGVFGFLLMAREASAEYRHRVLLLEHQQADDGDRELLTRVRAELAAAGFDVVVLAAPDNDPKQAVESAGHELHPASVLLVERLATAGGDGEGGVELWLSDRMLRKTVVLRLKAPEPDAQSQSSLDEQSRQAARVAVQAVELVKARLAELSVTREPASAPPVPAPAPGAPATAPSESRARPNVTLGVGLLDGFQAGQRAFAPMLRLGVRLPERWVGHSLAIDVRTSLVGLGRAARIERAPGAATLRHTAVWLDGIARFLPNGPVQPWLALGGGVLALDVVGTAPEPYRNNAARTLSGLVDVGAGLWLQPVSGIGLAVEGELMDAWSKTVVRIAGEDAAEVAAPLLLLSCGLMAEF